MEDFKRIAENWDKLPERAQGKIDGIISMAASAFFKRNKESRMMKGEANERIKSN